MIKLSRAATETGIDERLLMASLELTNNDTLNDLLHIDRKYLQAAVALVEDLDNYPNLPQFLEENSKAYGDVAEKMLISTLGLAKARSSHSDGYDRIHNNDVEFKVARPLMERKKAMVKSFAQRAYFFDPNNPCRGNPIYQHVKPSMHDVLLGSTIYMDATVIHLVPSNKINKFTDPKLHDPSKIRLRYQQANQETEGYVNATDLPIVAIIQGVPFANMGITMDDLMKAYENNEPIYITNGVPYTELDSVLGW